MKVLKKLAATAAVAMLATQPVMAANPASKLSLSNSVSKSVRASSTAGKSKQLEGAALFGVIAAVVVAVVVVIVVTDGDDSN